MVPAELELLVRAVRDREEAAINALADLLWERHDAQLIAAVIQELVRPTPYIAAWLNPDAGFGLQLGRVEEQSLVAWSTVLSYRVRRILCVQFLELLGHDPWDQTVPLSELTRFSGLELQGMLSRFGDRSLVQVCTELNRIGLHLRGGRPPAPPREPRGPRTRGT